MEEATGAAGRRIRRSAEEWRELFTSFDQSGHSHEQFCAGHDLGVSTFGRWRQRLREEARVSPGGDNNALFVELVQETPTREAPPWEVELQLNAYSRWARICTNPDLNRSALVTTSVKDIRTLMPSARVICLAWHQQGYHALDNVLWSDPSTAITVRHNAMAEKYARGRLVEPYGERCG